MPGSTLLLKGPELASQAIDAGLVDEFQMIVCPVVVGGGKQFFPNGVQLDLELVDERRFRKGVIVRRYAVRGRSK
jgi:dihydrofolate reductase